MVCIIRAYSGRLEWFAGSVYASIPNWAIQENNYFMHGDPFIMMRM